jgi:ABC-type amino acid transport substrate-binding protein
VDNKNTNALGMFSLKGVLISLVLLLGACWGINAFRNDKSILVVGVAGDYAPFAFLENGEPKGFDVDIIQSIASELGARIEFKLLAFEMMFPFLERGEIDVGIGSITPTPEREAYADFSHLYFNGKRALLLRSDSDIEEFNDLKQKTVGVQKGSIHEELVNTEWRRVLEILMVKSEDKIDSLVPLIANQNLDALVLEADVAQRIAQEDKRFKTVILPSDDLSSALALPRGSPLLSKINKIIERMKYEGELDKLKAKWSL